GMYSGEHQVAAGSAKTLGSQLYVGPKLQHVLEEIAPGLELTVDYGWLTVLSKPLFWLLEWIHSVVQNWGWAIIILTILIKAVFYKLSETSYRSMAHMKMVAPRMQALKERYGDDKQRMQQALMELYKKEKINPLGGCLPILVQIPVFIALYWVLLESVELRQAPWILWIQDLSVRDPFFVLPVLMGATMFIQHKLNPTPVDPMQAKIMMMLPIVFTFFFMFFPAGLVLYWVVNNTLSIAQQWYITRVVLAEKS
ncbi:MAG: membrane protein insertase YidC, partial [Pseudomonadota bacterium]